jgi:hypothetical protein
MAVHDCGEDGERAGRGVVLAPVGADRKAARLGVARPIL